MHKKIFLIFFSLFCLTQCTDKQLHEIDSDSQELSETFDGNSFKKDTTLEVMEILENWNVLKKIYYQNFDEPGLYTEEDFDHEDFMYRIIITPDFDDNYIIKVEKEFDYFIFTGKKFQENISTTEYFHRRNSGSKKIKYEKCTCLWTSEKGIALKRMVDNIRNSNLIYENSLNEGFTEISLEWYSNNEYYVFPLKGNTDGFKELIEYSLFELEECNK